MKTQETGLLAEAEALAETHPPSHAVILDLSGVLHIDEPVFRRTLTRWLAGPEGEGVRAYPLAHTRLALVIEDDKLPQRRAALSHVAGVLAEHRRGSIRALWYNLAREGGTFRDAVRGLVEQAEEGALPVVHPPEDELGRFLTIERSLHACDLASLVRQRPAYALTEGQEPRLVLLELTIALHELERMFGIPLVQDGWLYARISELLDRRMLFHLLRDRSAHPVRMGVKLHAETVAGEEFSRVLSQFPARLHATVVVELPYLEWVADRQLVVRAITAARAFDLGVAIDHVPFAALTKGDLPEADYYRVPWIEADGTTAALADAPDAVSRFGTDRCILTRCTRPEAIQEGLAAGFTLFQGSAVDALEASKRALVRERRQAQLVLNAEAEEPGTPAADGEAEAPAATDEARTAPGWLARLFSGSEMEREERPGPGPG